MFGKGWRVGRIAGFDIRVDLSWVLIAAIVALGFVARMGARYEGFGADQAFALGILLTGLFFGSVLLHELAHAVVSRRRGIPVEGITLFALGGLTHMRGEARAPRDEFAISVAGPATSLALAALFWGAHAILGDAMSAPIVSELGYLAWINLILGVFNLLPGLPLDGGRILRAAVWRVRGDASAGTRVAAWTGMGLGYLMLGFGVYAFLSGGPGGLWIALIGWFAASSARAALQDDAMRSRLGTRTVADLLPVFPMSVDRGAPLDVAADAAFLRGGERAVLVRDGERVVGVLTVEAVRAVPEPRRPFLRVADAMSALDDQPVVEAQTPAPEVLERVLESRTAYVLVRRDGEPVGIVSAESLAGWVGRSARLQTTSGRR